MLYSNVNIDCSKLKKIDDLIANEVSILNIKKGKYIEILYKNNYVYIDENGIVKKAWGHYERFLDINESVSDLDDLLTEDVDNIIHGKQRTVILGDWKDVSYSIF